MGGEKKNEKAKGLRIIRHEIQVQTCDKSRVKIHSYIPKTGSQGLNKGNSIIGVKVGTTPFSVIH